MITHKEALELKRGDILIDSRGKRWKVNGKVQTWKRDPFRLRVPLKHGLYVYDALTETDFLEDDGNEHVCKLLTKGE
jgi:hypothetical protein